MKCTVIDKDKPNGKCNNETGVDCPPQWIKHAHFDPLVLRIFFMGVEGITEEDIKALNAFVCDEHRPKWNKGNRRNNISRQSAKKRKERIPSYDPTI